MTDVRHQAVSGLITPQQGEALIREAWPSVTARPAVATLGRKLVLSIVLAPLGWFLMLPYYFLKILPFVARRYTLTNRRVMVRVGLMPKPAGVVSLSEISGVRVVKDDNSDFFRAGDLEILAHGKVLLTLRGVPEPEAFRISILNACGAWAPAKAPAPATALLPGVDSKAETRPA